MRRLLTLCSAFVGIILIAPASGEQLDAPDVCSDMQVKGARLLQGDTTDFFMVEAFGDLFPFPDFFQASLAGTSDRPSMRIDAVDLPYDPKGREALHEQRNTCGWMVATRIGRSEDLHEHAGGKEKLLQEASAIYAIGSGDETITIAVNQYPEISEIRSVTAWNEEHYVSLIANAHDNALWLLWLFDQYRSRE